MCYVRIIFAILAVCCCMSAEGQDTVCPDSVHTGKPGLFGRQKRQIDAGILFPLSGSGLDKSAHNSLDSFAEKLDSVAKKDEIESTLIKGMSSPDGPWCEFRDGD